MACATSTKREGPALRLVGLGDSSFDQLPCSAAIHCFSSTDEVQVSCGSTASLLLLVPTGREEGAQPPPPRLLEWGTGMYGERMVTVSISQRGEGKEDKETFLENTTAQVAASMPARGHSELACHPTEVSLMKFAPALGTGETRILSIACGAHFVVAAMASGGCITWGGGGGPELQQRTLGRGDCCNCQSCPIGATTHRSTAPSSASCSAAARECDIKPDWVQEPLGQRGSEVVNLAAGDDHAIAVCRDGSVWAWGRGDCGQLGCGSGAYSGVRGPGSCRPVSVHFPFSTRKSSAAGGRKSSGNGRRGGDGGDFVREAACGRDHSALLTERGRVFTFGSGLYGQLGVGTVGERAWTPTPVELLDGVGTMRADGTFTGIVSVACGTWHTAAVSSTGDVYAWGWARFGALGSLPGDASPRPSADEASESNVGDTRKKRQRSVPMDKGEDAEVRPYPGLVDGLEPLLQADDQIMTVGCGARYTLALSRAKRAYAWGQVSPRNGGAQQRNGDCNSCQSNSVGGCGVMSTSGSFSRPRELDTAELMCFHAAGCSGERCVDFGRNGDGDAVVNANGEDGKYRWRVAAAGCGPWYVVLGLEEAPTKTTGSEVVRREAGSLVLGSVR